MVRPWKTNEALIALAGAGLLLTLGLVSPADALSTLAHDWNTFFFFLGLMSISVLAEVAGFFDWLAAIAARLSGNSARRLFLNTFLLGSLISMFLSNDATALILTPIVYSLTTRLRLPVLPYLFACTFIADSASFLLPVSNPINIIVLSTFPLDLWTFLRLLVHLWFYCGHVHHGPGCGKHRADRTIWLIAAASLGRYQFGSRSGGDWRRSSRDQPDKQCPHGRGVDLFIAQSEVGPACCSTG